MNEELLTKIKKLLALAASSANEHEAKLAAARVNELLVKYNLDLQQAEALSDGYAQEQLPAEHRLSMEAIQILPVLQRCFFVKSVSSRQLKRDERGMPMMNSKGDFVRTTTVTLVGEKTNLQIALYVYAFLTQTYRELFTQYRRRTGAKIAARWSYYRGLSAGLVLQLEQARAKAETDRGLVLVRDPGLTKYYQEQFPNLRARKTSMPLQAEHVAAGTADGQKIRINKGVEAPTTFSGKLLK